MTICKLISSELEAMSRYVLPTLSPQNYDEVIKGLSKNVSKLGILQKILNISSGSLDKINAYWRQKGIEINNITLKDLFAYKVEEITNQTVFYIGNLDYNEYEKANPKAKSLPDALKVVFGKVTAFDSEITVIYLAHLEGYLEIQNCKNLVEVTLESSTGAARLHNNSKLTSIHIKGGDILVRLKNCKALKTSLIDVDRVVLYIEECPELEHLSFKNVTGDLSLTESLKLKLGSINSFDGRKIFVENELIVWDGIVNPAEDDMLGNLIYKLDKKRYVKKELLKKFDVKKENIVVVGF